MRILRWTSLGVVAALASSAISCDNNTLTSLNTDPNRATDAPAGPVFTAAARTVFSNWLSGLTSFPVLVQHLSEFQYPTHDLYSQGFTAGDMSEYNGSLINLQQVISKGKALNAPGIFVPAQVLEVIDFHQMSDQVGDIPYSEALNGVGGVLTPVYETQQSIYMSFFTILTKASADLAAAPAAAPGLGTADIVYGGNLGKWEKFANSLHLRLALRVVNVDPVTADKEIRAALAAPGGLILTNADNAILRWPGDNVYNNPWANTSKSRDDVRMARLLVDFLKSNSDPRLQIYAMPLFVPGTTTYSNQYAGKPPGQEPGAAALWGNTSSRFGAVFYPGATTAVTAGGKGLSMPSFMLTAAETNFSLAEAAERGLGGLTPAQAAGYYTAALTQSVQQWSAEVTTQALPATLPNATPVTAAQITTYLAQPGVVYQGGLAGLKQIATQKWAALYTDGLTAWAEWRRTCQPAGLIPGPDAVPQYVPRRFPYPSSEASLNGTNLAAAIARQGADNYATRIWWDSKPSAAPTCN